MSLHIVDELNINYTLLVNQVSQKQGNEDSSYEIDKETYLENKKSWLDTSTLIFSLLIFVVILTGIAVGRKR